NVVKKLQDEFSIDIVVREILTGGKSGAFVAIVDCRGNVDGIFVLKVAFNTEYNTEDILITEASSLGAFSNKIANIVASTHTENAYCLLVQIAGGSRLTWRPLVIEPYLIKSAYKELCRALWTPDLLELKEQLESLSLIKVILGYRLDPKKGRIHHNIGMINQVLITSKTFVHLERQMPNPYYYSLNYNLIKSFVLRPIFGPCHGDLHPGNLFIQIGQEAKVLDVRLIDFASFVKSAPFFYDHAYFELSMLLKVFEGIAPKRWLELCLAFSDGDNELINKLHPNERAWVEDIHDAKNAAISMAKEFYPSRYDDIYTLYLISHIASGLSFLNKPKNIGDGSFGLTANQYQMSLIWSATFLSTFFKITDTKVVDESNSVPIIGPQNIVPDHICDDDWKSISLYEQPGINILILGSEVRENQYDSLKQLFRVNWNIIFDFCTNQLPDPAVLLSPRPIRASWPGGEQPSSGLIESGHFWVYANGRNDISACNPARDYRSWFRQYRRWVEDLLNKISTEVGPHSVRVLCFCPHSEADHIHSVMQYIDSEFADSMQPILVACNNRVSLWEPIKTVCFSPEAILSRFETSISMRIQSQDASKTMVPCRLPTGEVQLDIINQDLLLRVSRDITIVNRSLSESIPKNRAFGIDFRRGMCIEWSELAANIDVPRDIFQTHKEEISKKLSASNNDTYNLLHQPSSGGTTLSRRLAWSLMEDFPTVILNQLTDDTASYLRDIFQFSRLPLLILMESSVVNDSERKALLNQLREDNTKGVFLWISRVYRNLENSKVLKCELSRKESERFYSIYKDQVEDPSRLRELSNLVDRPNFPEQRSPF
ncbi:MAG: hypothetical protein AB1633_08945, partial [Elusimicrobiota bacterium]